MKVLSLLSIGVWGAMSEMVDTQAIVFTDRQISLMLF